MFPRLLCLDFFAIALLAATLVQWLATIRAYRRLSLELIWQMVRLALRTIKVFLLIVGLFGIFGAIGSLLLPDYFLPLPFLYQFALGFSAVTSVCLPPSVLLLGASKARNAGLYNEIMWGIAPLKLTHMLNDFEFGAVHGEPLHQFSYRALPSASWEAIVHQFMESVPIVVIDTRTTTPSVLRETRILLSSSLRSKTIFIVESSRGSSAAMLVRSSMNDPLLPICAVTPNQLAPFLKNVRNRLLFG